MRCNPEPEPKILQSANQTVFQARTWFYTVGKRKRWNVNAYRKQNRGATRQTRTIKPMAEAGNQTRRQRVSAVRWCRRAGTGSASQQNQAVGCSAVCQPQFSRSRIQ